MAMVISPRSKIVTLSLLVGIIILVALIITGVIGIWHKSEKSSNSSGTKMVSSKLQQFTGYTATKHLPKRGAVENLIKKLGQPFVPPGAVAPRKRFIALGAP
ncbi:hypothetical protein KM043_012108 [Ampulex compressa]|nr:hypothetical protein KM043_012108 [Ampulex compressa]